MIHFRCGCGKTISADEDEGGGTILCPECGREAEVPAAGDAPAGARGDAAETRPHDFDAEIFRAARTSPRRPLKTPPRITPTGERSPGEAGEADAETPRRRRGGAAGTLFALLVLGLFLAAAALSLAGGIRDGLPFALAGFGLLSFGVLRALFAIAAALDERATRGESGRPPRR